MSKGWRLLSATGRKSARRFEDNSGWIPGISRYSAHCFLYGNEPLFLIKYDFSGKTIIPFVTHGGSGFSSTICTIQSLEPDATVTEAGLSISRNSVASAQADVKSWTDSLLAD